MVTELEIAYAAGLTDGEGCLRMFGSKSFPNVIAEVKMGDINAIEYLHRIFGGSVRKAEDNRSPLFRDMYRWTTSGSSAVDFCKKIYPYSITKKREHEVVLSLDKKYPFSTERSSLNTASAGARRAADLQLKELKKDKKRIITLDIETFGLDPKTLPVLSCSFMLNDDESSVFSYSILDDGAGELELLKRIKETLESCAYTIGWNSSRFDIPYINTRLGLYREPPMFLGSHDDADILFDKAFHNKKRTSLVNAANQMKVTDEEVHKTPINWDIWNAAHQGDKEAMKYVTDHSEKDVILTKRVYDAIPK